MIPVMAYTRVTSKVSLGRIIVCEEETLLIATYALVFQRA
jgi:hypothetical protein